MYYVKGIVMMMLLSDIVTSEQFFLNSSTGDVAKPVILKKGEPMSRLKDISQTELSGRLTLEKNGTLVLRLCSPEDEVKGCKNFTLPRFSVQTVNDRIFIALHNVADSDAGIYVFQVSGKKEELLNVTVETEPPNILAICLIILAVILLLLLVRCIIYKHKEKIKICLKGKPEPYCDVIVQSSECEETSMDSVIIIDNINHRNLQPLLLSDGKTSSPSQLSRHI